MNSRSDFERACQHIEGEKTAELAIQKLSADPDSVAAMLVRLLDCDGQIVQPTPRLLGYCRLIGKRLEPK